MRAIKVLKMAGSKAINIFNTSAQRSTVGVTATATYQLANTGIGSRTQPSGSTATWTWLNLNPASSYDVRATLQSGSAPSGDVTGAWLNLGTTRNWSETQTVVGTATCQLLIEIRSSTTLVVVNSAVVTITASVS